MRNNKCIVSTCNGIHSVQHNLPESFANRKKWLIALDREDLIEKPYYDVCNLKVCGAHFDLVNYRSAESFILHRNALPIPINKDKSTSSVSQESKEVDSLRIDVGRKNKCIVKGCESSMKPYHRLPKRKDLRDKWLHNLGRNELEDVELSILIHRGVCGAHFHSSQYTYPGSGRLLRNVVPPPLIPDDSPPPVKTTNNEHEAIIENLLKDAAISTGTVTAPLLCDNKVLLKTKSTYSKHKYKMTYQDDGTSSQITDADKIKEMIKATPKNEAAQHPVSSTTSDVLQVSNDEDEIYTSYSDKSFVEPLTSTKSKLKTKYVSILKRNITNNKKRKYNEVEKDLEKADVDNYDNKLFSILEEVKSLPDFLDIIFGFLYRRTDYYQTSTDPNTGVGLPDGVAKKVLWQAFQKYEDKHRNEDTDPKAKKQEDVAEKQVKASVNETVEQPKSEARLFETYNGAVYENYAWSQSITDLDIQIKIPDKITCKQLQIDIRSAQMLIKLKNSESVYLKGDLCKKCKADETVWSLGGQILQIHLEKQVEGWWDCLLKTEPRLDFNKMDSSRTFKKLTEVKIQQLCNDGQINLKESLVWKSEETPFVKGYNPLIETCT